MLYRQARNAVEHLVERFARLSARNRKGYNEPATRQEFILPLFRALGWNTDDSREVSPEEKVSRGYVDFAFRLRSIPRFFLETKRILADLEDPKWAFQAINYAWLKGVTWAVLSDFEGLKVFNAEWQESLPARAIFKDLHWQEYLDRFDDLWLLSRPAMEESLLDREAEKVGKKTKKAPVTRQLFADLTEWRGDLFQHLRPYNPLLTIEQIDQAVQRILDRLIFIRTCEDRELEPHHLRALLHEWRGGSRRGDLVRELNKLFRELDQTYNARLFAPHFCEELTSEPTPFERIIEGLYEVPGGYATYDFSAIDADVLGAIYEQYLGYVAQDPAGKEVVSKRMKRKAQGIYYTPQFVVRYIVGQTLGRFLEENGYDRARQVRVLDMACGSGSFLIEAFDVLDRYLAGERAQLPASPAGDTHDYARRMEILAQNLYGVDLDAQAVEIARLNLLLKALNQRGRLAELANVRQGNSLISGPPEELKEYFGENWREKRPFNWEEQFSEAMAAGGFDVIIGNPPYIRIQTLPKDDAAWYKAQYRAAAGNYDIYVLFVERALELLRPGGVMGLILPNKFFTASYGKGLRELLSEKKAVWQVVDFEDAQVFEDSTTYTCLLFLRKEPNPKTTYLAAGDWLKDQPGHPALMSDDLPEIIVDGKRLGEDLWAFLDEDNQRLLDKALSFGWPLNKVAQRIYQGLITGADPVFLFEGGKFVSDTTVRVDSEALIKTVELEIELLKPVVRSGSIGRYWANATHLVLFPYVLEPEGARLLSEVELKDKFCKAWSYLLENKERLESRERGKFRGKGWYRLSRTQNLDMWERPKIMIPYMIQRLSAFPDMDQDLYFVNVTTGGYGLITADERISLLYLTALLNSRLLDYLLKLSPMRFQHGYFGANKQYIEGLPIRRIDFSDAADVARHDKMVEMVEEMLRLQKERAEAEALKDDRRHDLARRIERLDREIDALVYELYGLTEEEIALVEGRK